MERVVVAARAGDVAALRELAGQLGYPAEKREIERRIAALAGRDDHALFVCREGGATVGWVHVFEAERLESDPLAEIGGLVVDAARRGQGIGRRLVEEAERWARGRGLCRLRVRSREERSAAHSFYESLGFARVKTQAVLDLALEDSND